MPTKRQQGKGRGGAGRRKPALTPKKNVPPVPQPDTSWHDAFLRAIAVFPNVRLAARQCGITRQDAYKHRDLFPDFAAAWDEAKEQGIDALELKLFSRANKSSDTLGIFFLKSHRPEIYRERHEVTGKDGGPIRVKTEKDLTDDELAAIATGGK